MRWVPSTGDYCDYYSTFLQQRHTHWWERIPNELCDLRQAASLSEHRGVKGAPHSDGGQVPSPCQGPGLLPSLGFPEEDEVTAEVTGLGRKGGVCLLWKLSLSVG